MNKILVTGAAGFIGYHVAKRLLSEGKGVIGLDNLSPYYDVRLKEARLAQLDDYKDFEFYRLDLADQSETGRLFTGARADAVVHLAAQTGVRYSRENPRAYAQSNLTGFLNVLEGCRHARVKHLVFASSSSVYGTSAKSPFSVGDPTDHPVSLYGATKKANELMAHSYSHLYGIPTTGLRFFSVYGPWGRPDMVLSLFTKAILEGRPIDVYNDGHMQRDFTFIDDVVESTVRILEKIPRGAQPPFRLFNVGDSRPVSLNRFIEILENCLGQKAKKNFLPLQSGDILSSCADVKELEAEIHFRPGIPLEEGIPRFLEWHRFYYETHLWTQARRA